MVVVCCCGVNAMVIFNNITAMSVLNENNRNASKLGEVIAQAASGMRINSAGDDASAYGISEKMRVRVRALGQCDENSVKGQDLLDTASAAVDEQVNIMKQVKTVAMRATDGTYTDEDRKILQKEVSYLLDQSENIAHTTFNDIYLLNQKKISSINPWFDPSAPYRPNVNNMPVLAQAATANKVVPPGGYMDITPSTVLYDPNNRVQGSPLTRLPADGSYVWDNGSGAPTLVYKDANGTLRLGSTTGTIVEVSGQANPPGSSTVATSTNVSWVNMPQITGTPAIGDDVALNATITGPFSIYKVEQNPFSGSLAIKTPTGTTSTGSAYNYIDELDLTALDAKVNSLPYDLDGLGFSFNCGGCEQFVTVMFDANTSGTSLYQGVSGNPPPLCYVVGVANVRAVPSLHESLGETIFNGINSATMWTKGAPLPSAVDTSTTIADRHDIKLNYHAATGKISITKNGPSITLMNGIRGEMKADILFNPWQDLYLQTNDKSSQHTRIFLPNTTLSILFPDYAARWDIVPQSGDYPVDWPKGYDGLSEAEKQAKWRNEVWPYPDRMVNLDVDHCVSTRERANVFLGDVDQAIKYLLHANTNLGAQSNRLDYTEDNIVVMQENVTAAESALRDADMAKSAMEYAKYNLLHQASQSMLAQANQTPQRVLSLLQ